MAQCQNEYCIVRFLMTVKRDIAGAASGDDQFPQSLLDFAPDQGMAFENGDSFLDQPQGVQRGERIALREEIRQAFQVVQRPVGIDQPCQDSVAGR